MTLDLMMPADDRGQPSPACQVGAIATATVEGRSLGLAALWLGGGIAFGVVALPMT